MLTEVSRKEIILGCNKNYITLALNCTLKNSKRMISVLEIERKGRNNNVKEVLYASSPIWKIHPYNDITFPTIQACLLWQPPFLQHTL